MQNAIHQSLLASLLCPPQPFLLPPPRSSLPTTSIEGLDGEATGQSLDGLAVQFLDADLVERHPQQHLLGLDPRDLPEPALVSPTADTSAPYMTCLPALEK
jgi:hypothetical protein